MKYETRESKDITNRIIETEKTINFFGIPFTKGRERFKDLKIWKKKRKK